MVKQRHLVPWLSVWSCSRDPTSEPSGPATGERTLGRSVATPSLWKSSGGEEERLRGRGEGEEEVEEREIRSRKRRTGGGEEEERRRGGEGEEEELMMIVHV